jgi:hypothetical protein
MTVHRSAPYWARLRSPCLFRRRRGVRPVTKAVIEHTPDAAVIVPPRATAVPSADAETNPTQRDQHQGKGYPTTDITSLQQGQVVRRAKEFRPGKAADICERLVGEGHAALGIGPRHQELVVGQHDLAARRRPVVPHDKGRLASFPTLIVMLQPQARKLSA